MDLGKPDLYRMAMTRPVQSDSASGSPWSCNTVSSTGQMSQFERVGITIVDWAERSIRDKKEPLISEKH